jgi:hypothetical protein
LSVNTVNFDRQNQENEKLPKKQKLKVKIVSEVRKPINIQQVPSRVSSKELVLTEEINYDKNDLV